MWQSCVPSSQYDDIPRVYPNYPPTKSHNTRSKAASSKKSSTKKMRKSTNQLQVLRNYFQTDPKPGRYPTHNPHMAQRYLWSLLFNFPKLYAQLIPFCINKLSINHPFLCREPVLKLAATTGLNFYEVRNWFRNARLRNKDGMDDKKFDGEKRSLYFYPISFPAICLRFLIWALFLANTKPWLINRKVRWLRQLWRSQLLDGEQP